MLFNNKYQYNQFKPAKARRISRACDECRKRKTKCVRLGLNCQTCINKHECCTFQLPSVRRGPKPKVTEVFTLNNEDNIINSPSESSSNAGSPFKHPSLPSSDNSSYFSSPSNQPSSISYKLEEVTWLNYNQFNLLNCYFQTIHPVLPIVDPHYLRLGLIQLSMHLSFKTLLRTILTITNYYKFNNSLNWDESNLPLIHPSSDCYESLNYNLVRELWERFPITNSSY